MVEHAGQNSGMANAGAGPDKHGYTDNDQYE